MSLDQELAALEAEEVRLREEETKLNKLKWEAGVRRREIIRIQQATAEEARLAQPTELRVCDLNAQGIVNVKVIPDMRPDILPIVRSIPGRAYDATISVNRMPIDAWLAYKPTLEGLKNVKVTHSLGVFEKIKRYIDRPEFHIMILGKELRIASHPAAYKSEILSLPGAAWAANNVDIKLPLSEAWRLLDIFQHYKRGDAERKIVWEAKALEMAEGELKRRVALEEILTLKDVTLPIKFARGQELMPFQRVGVKALDTLDGVGFLADQMGLGKTWQAVALALLREWRVAVVCPAHLKANWMREIINLTGIIPTVLYGREPDPNDIHTLVVTKPRFVIINYDILGTKTEMPEVITVDDNGDKHLAPSHTRYLWPELLNMSKFDLVILDEAHYIKSRDAHRAKACLKLVAPGRLPMSGTPILNRPGEFYNSLHWLRPDMFPSGEKFDYQFTNNGKGAKNVGQLRELLKTLMIRRLKRDVVADLPPINRITRMYDLSPEAKSLYAEVLKGVYRAIDAAGNQVERNITSILVEIGKLKEVCAMDAVPHVVEHAMDLVEGELDADRGQGKVLIFSQYKAVVGAIAQQLSCPFWTGDTPMDRRNTLEQQFQNDPNSKFLVVSLMTGQTGLNLTAAGHVIFADLYWTPASHAQAEERAYGRLNDMHGADSYYFMAIDTIMQWIWEDVIQTKIALINEVVEGLDQERDVGAIMGIIQRFKQLRLSA